jgi:hypothetical protein
MFQFGTACKCLQTCWIEAAQNFHEYCGRLVWISYDNRERKHLVKKHKILKELLSIERRLDDMLRKRENIVTYIDASHLNATSYKPPTYRAKPFEVKSDPEDSD